MPCAAGFDERRNLAGEFVIDRVFVAADALGIRVGGVDRGQRLPQCFEIAGELQPAVPHALCRTRQHPARRDVGLGYTVEIGDDLDAHRAIRARLVAGDLDPKGLVAHVCRIILARNSVSLADLERTKPKIFPRQRISVTVNELRTAIVLESGLK